MDYKLQDPKKLLETNHDFYTLLGTGRLVVLYKNKYIPVKNVRGDKRMIVIVLDNDDGTLLPFNNWVEDLYVF
jgi:hypothetical protein